MKTHIEYAWWYNTSFWYDKICQVIETGQLVYVLSLRSSVVSDFYTHLNTDPFYLTVRDIKLCMTFSAKQKPIRCLHADGDSAESTVTLVSIYTLKFTT